MHGQGPVLGCVPVHLNFEMYKCTDAQMCVCLQPKEPPAPVSTVVLTSLQLTRRHCLHVRTSCAHTCALLLVHGWDRPCWMVVLASDASGGLSSLNLHSGTKALSSSPLLLPAGASQGV